MRLTLDGSNDEKNAFQGLSDFSFREEDAGVFDPAAISDVEEEEESDLDDSDIEVTENLPDYAVDPEEGAAAVLTVQQHIERFSATDSTLSGSPSSPWPLQCPTISLQADSVQVQHAERRHLVQRHRQDAAPVLGQLQPRCLLSQLRR